MESCAGCFIELMAGIVKGKIPFPLVFYGNSSTHFHSFAPILGVIHTGRATRPKQMEPVCVNGSVPTARKQHQRVCVWICVHASCVDEALGCARPKGEAAYLNHPAVVLVVVVIVVVVIKETAPDPRPKPNKKVPPTHHSKACSCDT